MTGRYLGAVLVGLAVVVLTGPAVAGRAAPSGQGEWVPPRTPWGDPDLQGLWTNTTTTPLERPADLAGRALLTEEERALRNPTTCASCRWTDAPTRRPASVSGWAIRAAAAR